MCLARLQEKKKRYNSKKHCLLLAVLTEISSDLRSVHLLTLGLILSRDLMS